MKIKKSILCTFGTLLLCSVSKVVYAQQVNNCPRSNLNKGGVCVNSGTVINQIIDNSKHYYYPATQNPETPSPISMPSTAKQHNPFREVVKQPVHQGTRFEKPVTSSPETPKEPITTYESPFTFISPSKTPKESITIYQPPFTSKSTP